jgi:hypothetical protein
MRSFINKIFKLLNFSGRDWVVFLLALLLAFSTWIIHKLSLEYSVYLTVEVVADSNIEGRSNLSTGATEIMAKCRTSGWRILYSHMTREDVVYVKFPASVFQHEDDERYYITSDKLHEYVDQIFGGSVSVEYFVTDKVYFKFQQEKFKRVPVKAVSSLAFEDQYIATGPLELVPDSVTVYGDKMHLDALDYVTTATIKHTSINEDFSGMISLTPISGMRFSVNEVHYKMDVSRYLEVVRKNVPVTVINAPAGKEYEAVPSSVDVILNVEFPLKDDPKKDILLVADYNDLAASLSGKVSVRLQTAPLGTIRYEVDPVAVRIKEKDE